MLYFFFLYCFAATFLTWHKKRASKLTVLKTQPWDVYIEKDRIRIGCMYHSVDEWMAFSDAEINKMHRNALRWWRKWKPIIVACHENMR